MFELMNESALYATGTSRGSVDVVSRVNSFKLFLEFF